MSYSFCWDFLTMTIDHSYWLLATGYWQLDDRIKLIGFSISCQKPKARGQKPPSSQVIVPQHRVPNLITSRLSWLLLRWPV